MFKISILNRHNKLRRVNVLNLFKRQLNVTATRLDQLKTKEADRETHFGFTTVKESEKAEKVHNIFETVASKYDLMNDAMSFGIHRIWKDIFIDRLAPGVKTKLLDVAGGTGDIAFRYVNYLTNLRDKEKQDISASHVTVCDINGAMLKEGQMKAEQMKIDPMMMSWQVEDAEKLSFKDDQFSVYTIAFGVRNVTHIDKVLREAYRVLVPGGRFLCLEFSQVNNETLRWIYDQYSFQMIPVMGQILAGQWNAYQYLVESIRKFPNQEDFKNMIEEAGFRCVTYENLTGGIVAIHSAFKI